MTLKRRLASPRLFLVALTLALLATASASAAPYTGPVKEVVASHFGAKVDATTGTNVCTVASKDLCQPGSESEIAGGLHDPTGVAVAANGNIYVADTVNNRVQELTATGTFVSTFGWEVNETKDKEPAATPAERNVCTAISGDVCKAGVAGSRAGQILGDLSVAVDPTTNDVYVEDHGNFRVDVFSAAGQFLFTIGADVNETKEKEGAPQAERNLCPSPGKSTDVCKAGVQNTSGGSEADAFNFAQGNGDLFAVGGPGDILYVGDEHRVQEFSAATGEANEGISLTSISSEPESKVVALALDQTSGALYLAYRVKGVANVVREFNGNKQTNEFPIRAPAAPEATVNIQGMALDGEGRLALLEDERGNRAGPLSFGSLYAAGTGHLITEFLDPEEFTSGVAFNGESEHDELFSASPLRDEVTAYKPVHVAELLAKPAVCKPGAEIPASRSATFVCGLNGAANPEEVSGTETWFQWGNTPLLGAETPKQPVAAGAALVGVGASVQGLRPDETYYYRLAGEDENVKSPELLTSETATFKTVTVAPEIVGAVEAPFVGASSAVVSAELNPEKAPTRYAIQYGPCESLDSCAGAAETNVLESETYGEIGATFEIKGLQPDTAYRYRLVADDRHEEGKVQEGARVVGAPGVFTTSPTPSVQATTGSASSVGATSATVSGSVDPDGQPATYEFEVGVDEGAATQYGVVAIGPVAASSSAVGETQALTGLQPNTTYAYRIAISSGYVQSESHKLQGAAQTFTTAATPCLLCTVPSLPMLVVPPISFPKPVPTCKAGYSLNKADKCVKTKRKKAKPKKKKKGKAHKKKKQKK